jgi:hypothetical protein
VIRVALTRAVFGILAEPGPDGVWRVTEQAPMAWARGRSRPGMPAREAWDNWARVPGARLTWHGVSQFDGTAP